MWAMDENTINGIICMMGGIVRGRIFSVTAGLLQQIMGTDYFSEPNFFKDGIVVLETGISYSFCWQVYIN